MAFLLVAGWSGPARAALEIDAKAVKTDSNNTEEIWVIRIQLQNTANNPLGPLVIQYRYSGFTEFDEDGKPEGPLEHTEQTLDQPVQLAPRQKLDVESPGMNLAGDGNVRKLAKGMIQDIRVRAWQQGKLVGEFAEKSGKAGNADWAMNPPSVPAGVEAGSGPWLLLKKESADFSGVTLGATAAEVFAMLKSQGPAKPDAKPEPFRSHPFRMTSADFPGVILAFDAAKKLSAIEITDPSRCKFPGGLILGESKLEDFDPVFGPGTKPDPLPTGAADARQFQLSGFRLTLGDTPTAPGIATAAFLERVD